MKTKFNWIFFDLDGTLANSIPVMYQVYLNFLMQFDKRGTKEEFEELNGPSLPEIVSIIKARYSLIHDKATLIDLYSKLIVDAYKSIVKPMEGASDILEALINKGYKLLLVTSASREIGDEFIKFHRWDKYFHDYVFGEEVNKAKPAVDIYELAMKKANVYSESVAVIEDSCNGIKAAKATGAFVIGLASNQSKEELLKAGANIAITHLREIILSVETDYEILAIGNIRLRTKENSQIDGIIAKNRNAIEETWQKSLIEKKGGLLNGTLPNFIGVNREDSLNYIITCHFIEYKSFLAQRKSPDLNLGINPIGVSGVIVLKGANKEYVVFAKRANDVTEYPGFFELVPSGSIDKECLDSNGIVDYKMKLMNEFSEETGLSTDYVKEITSFAFVLDTNHNVYDICCKILLESTIEQFFEKFKTAREYQAPVAIAINELEEFINSNYVSIIPTSRALVDAYMRELR